MKDVKSKIDNNDKKYKCVKIFYKRIVFLCWIKN